MADLPEHLLRRSAEARAKATGRPVEEILAELKGEAPATPAAEAPPVESEPETGDEAASKIPAHLLARSRAARARSGDDAAAPAAPSTAPSAATTTTAPAPTVPAVPENVRTQRLLTVVKARAIQQVRREPQDKVNTWPHLVAIEFVALLAVTAFLVIFSVIKDAPLLELANFNAQPNPSKAPWYFLGLQELLSYFDPQVAGVMYPTLGLVGLAAIPYIDRNPSTRPADRKLAIMIFTFFLMAAAVTTMFGSFYRGPGFNFSFPWSNGIFFDF